MAGSAGARWHCGSTAPSAQISFLSSAFRMSLIHFLLVNRDAGIRADNRTRCASDTGIGHHGNRHILCGSLRLVVGASVCVGQATTHRLHPLQRSSSTTMAPFILLIVSNSSGIYLSGSSELLPNRCGGIRCPLLPCPAQNVWQMRQKLFSASFASRIIEVLVVESHDLVDHAPCLHGRAFWG